MEALVLAALLTGCNPDNFNASTQWAYFAGGPYGQINITWDETGCEAPERVYLLLWDEFNRPLFEGVITSNTGFLTSDDFGVSDAILCLAARATRQVDYIDNTGQRVRAIRSTLLRDPPACSLGDKP